MKQKMNNADSQETPLEPIGDESSILSAIEGGEPLPQDDTGGLEAGVPPVEDATANQENPEGVDYETAGKAVLDDGFQQSLVSVLDNVQRSLQTQNTSEQISALYEVETFLQTIPGNEKQELPAPTTEPPPLELGGGVPDLGAATAGVPPQADPLAGAGQEGIPAAGVPPSLGI